MFLRCLVIVGVPKVWISVLLGVSLYSACSAAPPVANGSPNPDLDLLQYHSAKAAATSVPPETLGKRVIHGQELYNRNCFSCHQINGLGVPGVFPPLAKSDFLTNDLARSIRASCEGLTGEIVVNKKRYAGAMPPVILDDNDLADVYTFVLNSWGNPGGTVSAEDVKKIRARTTFPTLEVLKASSVYPPLPKAPDGLSLREVLRLPFKGVRITSDGQGKVLYILTEGGDIWRLTPDTAQLKQVHWASRYLEKRDKDLGGPLFVLAAAMDDQKRLYVAANQQNGATKPFQNIVTIYRSSGVLDGDPADLKPWFQTNYPGSPAYIHAVEHMAFGPDGMLYVGNGARTDGGQTGPDGDWYGGGETPITACMWRLDPRSEKPALEVFAQGLRNAYGFCWNPAGEMFATENGPDADAPEELNQIQKGHHYGFPYTFADWGKRKAYNHTPEPPPGVRFTLPIANVGPDGGYDGKPMYTFDPHSGPGGIVYLGDDFPEPYRSTFFLTRFGNFIRTPKDNVGFDVLQARLRKNANGVYEAEIKTLLAPLGRPIDIHQSGRGKLYICEYSRPTTSSGSFALSGRILELSAPVKP